MNTTAPTTRTEPADRSPARRARRRFRRYGLVTLLALAVGLTFAAGAPSASATVTFPSGTWVTTIATSDCTNHTIDVHPNPSAGSQWSTYSMAQVYDYAQNRWVTSGWQLDDNLNTHLFVNMTSFYDRAYMTYARVENGSWLYRYEWAPITSDVVSIWCANMG